MIGPDHAAVDAFVAAPSLSNLLAVCAVQCEAVKAKTVTEFPPELRPDDARSAPFWGAVRKVADDCMQLEVPHEFAVLYPGRTADGDVLRWKDVAESLADSLGGVDKAYYADGVRDGRFDESIARAVVQCSKAVFVVSPEWVERKWCLAELLLAMASDDRFGEQKCKVIECEHTGLVFAEKLLPLKRTVLREQYDSKKGMRAEIARILVWLRTESEHRVVAWPIRGLPTC